MSSLIFLFEFLTPVKTSDASVYVVTMGLGIVVAVWSNPGRKSAVVVVTEQETQNIYTTEIYSTDPIVTA
ncbi:hypothetical protein QVD17_01356 [Tagetes erecta]|uniref:Uncharacterized protein n=1 Tax=Tagetes erecta TaxID=13708 RepID=A0AAD8L4S5_TARER|nr:hypothetical protein QVD17_01356 [Tagetes erecta]